MERLKMQSHNIIGSNIQKIAQLFPQCVTERLGKDGKPELGIDFEKLQAELSNDIIGEGEERYQFTWPDKRAAARLANTPTTMTLRPCREESVDFDHTQNLYIEGDNLDVLKVLRETYLNKLNVIYIDPPYNTGNDILYTNDYYDKEDEFGAKYEIDELGMRRYINSDSNGRYHTNWLNMMYPRIKVAKNLLAEDGFFLIAIDHNELINIGEVCDEIFGYGNRVGVISVVHKPEGRNQAKFIGPSNEFMLIYAKNEQIARLQKVVLDEEQQKAFACSDDKGAYRLKNFIRLADGKYATKEAKPNFWYPIYVKPDCSELSLINKENYVCVYPITETGVERTWKTTKETFWERYIAGDIIACNNNKKIIIFEKLREEQVIKTHWIDKKYHGYHFGTKLLDDLLGVKTFDFPKSLFLMKDIIKLFCPKGGLILDFFSGSGTTAHAVMKLNAEDDGNRRFILAQIAALCDHKSEAYKAGYKNICEIGKERIRRAGRKIKADSPLTTQNLDVGFRVLKLDSSNMLDVYYTPEEFNEKMIFQENVKADRTDEDLLFQVMLELGIELSASIRQERLGPQRATVFNVDDGYLMATFEQEIDEATITEIAKRNPGFFVMRDASAASDNVLDNFEQLFRHYSPETSCRII